LAERMTKYTNHDGSEIDPADVFFAEPPGEIGAVVSATTSRNPCFAGKRRALQILQGTLCGVLGLIFGGIIGGIVGQAISRDAALYTLALFALALAALGAWIGAKFLVPDVITYVGTDGAARITQYGPRRRIECVRFSDAQLGGFKTPIMVLGKVLGQRYFHHFKTPRGRFKLVAIETETMLKVRYAAIHFLRAAERAYEARKAA
jgi:hypothetical protein